MHDFDITDELLADCKVNAYSCNCTVSADGDKEVPVNPKKFPTKAISVIFHVGAAIVEIFLDTELKKWNSRALDDNGKFVLTGKQMLQFFATMFFKKLISVLKKKWPLSDKFHNDLFKGACACKIVNGNELRKSDIQSLNLKVISNEISEDMVSAPGDATTADAGEVTSPSNSGAIKTDDILGKCDHAKDGYMGDGCFHMPKSVLSGEVITRIPKSKNPYIKK